ncbi:alkaline phosphatase D family protein [Altererythrobacter sp.]|uniref:alkaline phosphatase D family protein n=1 Tax=Altererythrobacter sp. TaxID=1872480 RepID=UPI003D02A76E
MKTNEPLSPPSRHTTALTRRHLFQLGGASALLATTPLAARGFGRGFTHGVASGEPGPDKVLLWTRFVAGQDTWLEFQVSENGDFTDVVAGGSARASAETDWCAKAWADGLRDGRWYYYRFIAPDGSMSEVGRTRTLPGESIDRFRLAVFSCSNFGFGYFNAYAHAAEVDDADLALHLGDYIYEYRRGSYPDPERAIPERELWPEQEIVALADYRLRYATYRADPDLRRIHQMLPMIAVWDDHESANDSWKGGAENHQSETEGDWEARKAAAKRAYREWMPVSDEPYAEYQVGDLATLYRLDTRLEGREKQFDIGALMKGRQSAEEIAAALKAFHDGDYADPARQMLGAEQEAWLGNALKRSRQSGRQWQVLVQQVVMGRLATPPGLVDALGADAPDYVRRRLTAAALSSRAGLPANMDAWDGYPAARERLLASALEAEANLLVLAGDSHNSWAFNLDHRGVNAGVEFGVQSVTSPGLEGYLGAIAPDVLSRDLVEHNAGLKYADTSQRGYALVELTPEAASAEYRYVETIRTRSTALAGTMRLDTTAGSRALAS